MIPRAPEAELMDKPDEVAAYAQADFAAVNQAFAERLAQLAGPIARSDAIDLGTGPGDIPIRVARLLPGWHITALDGSQPMLDVAQAAIRANGLSPRITTVLANAAETRLPGAAYHVIFSNSILHHVAAPRALWTEIKRIARPGALVLVRDLLRPESEAQAREIVAFHAGNESALLQEEFYRSLLSAYTVSEVQAQLRQCGLDGLRVEQITDRHLDVYGQME